jgi:hypothetical protein
MPEDPSITRIAPVAAWGGELAMEKARVNLLADASSRAQNMPPRIAQNDAREKKLLVFGTLNQWFFSAGVL